MDRQLELIVKGNKYITEFPNVGVYQNIETMKQIVSKGMYASLMSVNTQNASSALDMIDMESYLTILFPQLIKDLKCQGFSDLGLEDYMELREIYVEKFIPWWRDILEILQNKKK